LECSGGSNDPEEINRKLTDPEEGRRARSRRQNIAHLVGNPQFEFMRHDITLAKEKLHWEPTVPLRDGLIRAIYYFRSNAGGLLE